MIKIMQYKRILLKLSGEALASKENTIEPQILVNVIKIIQSVQKHKVQLAIVIGGGNIFRGKTLAEFGINKITGDHMGMLATVINALAIDDVCKQHNIQSTVMSGFAIGGGVCDAVNHTKAKQLLNAGEVVIFSAGTGNPCFTTDSAASLRAIEIDADCVFKATNVDGVYSADPKIDKNATKYQSLSFDEAITKELKIMDTSAFALCKEYNLPICVFSMLDDPATLGKILAGANLGTMIKSHE